MIITKIQSVILDFGKGSPIFGEVKLEIGPLKVIESNGFCLTNFTDEQFKIGHDLMIDQQRSLNEGNGFKTFSVRIVRRERS